VRGGGWTVAEGARERENRKALGSALFRHWHRRLHPADGVKCLPTLVTHTPHPPPARTPPPPPRPTTRPPLPRSETTGPRSLNPVAACPVCVCVACMRCVRVWVGARLPGRGRGRSLCARGPEVRAPGGSRAPEHREESALAVCRHRQRPADGKMAAAQRQLKLEARTRVSGRSLLCIPCIRPADGGGGCSSTGGRPIGGRAGRSASAGWPYPRFRHPAHSPTRQR
jgi:hypothetical protein